MGYGASAIARGGALHRDLDRGERCCGRRVVQELGPDATAVTQMVDSGLRHLSTNLFRGP
jgi:hypothetical protein